jgi:ABC-type Fe3+/spermidine/putrescine transport system ATPase subunit
MMRQSLAAIFISCINKAFSPMSLLQVSGINRQEEGSFLLKDISFSQEEFQKIAIAGATGSGKTTLLKIIAGLIQPDAGEVLLEGLRVKGPGEKLIPGYTCIAYLSQHFELRNHYKVEEILQMANLLSDEEAEMIYEVCRIKHLMKRSTNQLSGGEKQRISLARLLVSSPRLLLLDEPFSNLDAIHTNILKTIINDIGEILNTTCILVAHEPADVLPWADEIIVLQEGQIIQKGSPVEMYRNPVNEYTAALFGKYNVIPPDLVQAFSSFEDAAMQRASRFIRPEDFKILHDESRGLKGEVNRVSFMGSHYETEISISGNKIIVNNNHGAFKKGDIAYVSLS